MISLSRTLRALAEEPGVQMYRERLIDAAEFVEANPKETFAGAWEQMQTTAAMGHHDINIRDALVRLDLMAWAPIMRERTRVTVANALVRYAKSKGLAG